MAISKITSKSIADGTVVGADITPGTVTNAKISPSAAIANAKLQNSSITVSGSSVSLGGSTTINTATDWQALTVADGSTQLTAVAGKGYFLDTNAGVIEVFLPSSPSRGDRIVLADYSGTFATNQCIINTGGKLIDSTAGPDFKLTTNNTIAELIYVDANKGWLVYLNQAAGTTPSGVSNVLGVYGDDPENYPYITATGGTITTTGDFKVHTFTGDGTFDVIWAGVSPAPSNVDYLVIAGGGAGASGNTGGGGGAGGFRTTFPSPCSNAGAFPITKTSYPITVGGGASAQGAPVSSVNAEDYNGSNSVFSTITSAGGGGGGSNYHGGPNSPNSCGADGGSGGGGGARGPSPGCRPAGGTGNTPPVSPSQGNPGGLGSRASSDTSGNYQASGGGGGAGGSGQNSTPYGGNGGAGTANSITGASVTRAGGGGGGVKQGGTGCGGSGGGGDAGAPSAGAGAAGTDNTGGGGGGGGGNTGVGLGGNGGKGVVIIRYKFQAS